jgi:hypothetical protein
MAVMSLVVPDTISVQIEAAAAGDVGTTTKASAALDATTKDAIRRPRFIYDPQSSLGGVDAPNSVDYYLLQRGNQAQVIHRGGQKVRFAQTA